MLRLLGGGVVAVTAGSLLEACGGSSGTTATTQATASGKPVRGGRLTLGVAGGSSKDLIDFTAGLSNADFARVNQLYDTLLWRDPQFKIQPGLATAVTPKGSTRQWTISLRKDVEFHDGRPMTAADVKHTLLSVSDPKNPVGPTAQLAGMDRKNIRMLDKHTLELSFDSPTGTLPDLLADPLSGAIRIIPATGYDPKKPVGTGPFKFKSFEPGQSSLFVRNENYWRSGQPYLDEIEVVDFTDDTARVNALSSGQINALASLPPSQIAVFKQNSRYQIVISETGNWDPFVMRTDKGPFEDVRVRQAFRMLADRPQMVEEALSGYGAPANDVFGRFDADYNSSLTQRVRDVSQAKRLLRSAGKLNFVFELAVTAADPYIVGAAQVLVQNAADAGVKLKLNQVDPATYWASYWDKSLQMTINDWSTRPILLQDALSLGPKAPYNDTHWNSTRWNALYTRAAALAEGQERKRLVHEAQQLEWDEGGYLIWGWIDTIDAVSTKVKGLVPDKTGVPFAQWRLRDLWIA